MSKIKDVLSAPPDAFSVEAVKFAKAMDEMQDVYAGMAANAASMLFTTQQALGLTGDQMKVVMNELIDVRQAVTDRTEAALVGVCVNEQPPTPAPAPPPPPPAPPPPPVAPPPPPPPPAPPVEAAPAPAPTPAPAPEPAPAATVAPVTGPAAPVGGNPENPVP